MRILLTVLLLMLPAGAQSLPTAWVVERAVDGDTLRIFGVGAVRIRDFDAPEIDNAACSQERSAGRAAKRFAQQLTRNQVVRLRPHGTDRYNRLIADVILADGRDFRDAMIRAGHGRLWRYGHERKPNWCR